VTFGQLRSFTEVARHGSVTAAAHALGVTEPAVSSAVGALKRELGDDLFVRTASGFVPTRGEGRLSPSAAEILLLAESAREDLRALH
jgi:LysR family transcriptional regulator, low CO2-responsive transcriptional regulator